jgi:hypothetical protein
MDPSISIGLLSVAVGIGSSLATLFVARRGGTFQRRSIEMRIGGQRLANGRSLTVVCGIPPDQGSALSSLTLQFKNPGEDTVDDIVVAAVTPRALGQFCDQENGKPIVKFEVERGNDPGTFCKVEMIGGRNLFHISIKSIHNLTGMVIEIPLVLTALSSMQFVVPVTFKDGETADVRVNARFRIPIEILLMARDRKTQHFTVELEVYTPPVFGFRPLASEWLSNIVSRGMELSSVRKKIRYWSRAVFGLHRCLLVIRKYHKTEIRNHKGKSKDKPITVLQEVPGTRRYAIGYLVLLFAFYRPLGNSRR